MPCPHTAGGGSVCAKCASWGLGAIFNYHESKLLDYDFRPEQKALGFHPNRQWLSNLCPPCQFIFLYPPEIWQRIPEYHKDGFPNPGRRHWNHHHKSINEMQKCGENPETPCRLCHLVFAVASMTPVLRPLFDLTGDGQEDSRYPSYEKREVRVAIEHRRRKNMEDGVMALDFDFADPYPGLQFLFVPIETNESLSLSIESLGEDTSTETTFALAKRWLKACLNDHAECASHQQHTDDSPAGWLPTRLLEVGPKASSTARLVLSKELMASPPTTTPKLTYAALSHCWGGADDILKLKSGNLDQLLRLNGINIQEDLPKTFQHAITICRELEIPYLWIDSLCIIQDSKDDWAYESSLMGKVYSKATLTIAATGSETSHSGIFFPRAGQEPKLEFHISGNPLDEYTNYGNSKSLSLVPQNWELTWHVNLDNASPLNDRGWTFQERLLSRRILHFGHLGIAWECETQCASEFAQAGYPADSELYLEGGSGRPTKPTCFLTTVPDSRMPEEVLAWDAWIKFVETYSQRSLTFASDRLVAISAVARAMQSQLGENDDNDNDNPSSYRYNAGLWRSTLLPELCWIVDWSLVSTADVSPVSKSSEPEGGPPSWSWGSTAHPVFFPFTGALLQERFTRLLVRLVEVETTPLPSFAQDPFGQVSGGVLTLKGRIIPVRIVKVETGEAGRPKEALWKLADAETGTPIQPAVWVSRDNDKDPGCSESSIYYILPIMHRLDECSNAVNMMLGRPATGPVQGLLLEKVDEATDTKDKQDEGSTSSPSYSQCLRRVGSFFIQDVYSDDNWFGFGQVEDDAYDEAMGEEGGTYIKII